MGFDQWAAAYVALVFVAANLPWFSRRRFFFGRAEPRKGPGWYFGEWFVLYLLSGVIGMGFERALEGHNHAQSWEFYVVGLCMFAVFAIPGFLWRFSLAPMLGKS